MITAPPVDKSEQRLLLVDDNVDAAEMLAELLQTMGFQVDVAHDGRGAFAALDTFSPAVILLDIGLPVMDGYDVARRIRARSDFKGAKFIALTGYGHQSDRERALAAGFDRHFVKPVDINQLLCAVAELTPSAT